MGQIMFSYVTRQTLLTNGDEFFARLHTQELLTVHNAPYSIAFPLGDANENNAGRRRRMTGVVHVTDIMYDDIKDCYKDLCKKYNKGKLDAVISTDPIQVGRKVTAVLYLAMNDVFQERELDVAFFYDKSRPFSLGSVIYSAIQQNFSIISQQIPSKGIASIRIRKGSKN